MMIRMIGNNIQQNDDEKVSKIDLNLMSFDTENIKYN